jgi:hypothetical protein
VAATVSSPGRRQFLRFASLTPLAVIALGIGAAGADVTAGDDATAPAPAGSGQASAAAVCPNEDESMRDTLNYLAVSPYGPTKDCTNCKLWSAPVAGASCGGCTLIDGAIDPHGYCDSWAPVAANSTSSPGIATSPNPGASTGG